MLYIRPPILPPELPELRQHRQILFRHPGYDDSNNVLFKLDANDTETDDGSPAQHPDRSGIYAQFALDACAIIAGNRTDGWLSTLRDPNHARNDQVDGSGILHAPAYYYHLALEESANGCNVPYPIVPSFREWRFPHDNIPSHWQQLPLDTRSLPSTFAPSNLTAALAVRDRSCRMTECLEEAQVAHILPRAEIDWWNGNGMSRYNYGPAQTLNEPTNAILLRPDLHIAFDKCRFVFVPKPSNDGSGMRLVFHLLDMSQEYELFYHNRELQKIGVGVQMLFARFAWTLFPLLAGFLACKENRRLTIHSSTNGEDLPGGYFPAAFCERFSLPSTRQRSRSPKKRKPDEETHDCSALHDNVNCVEKESPSPSPTRGRSKRRKTSRYTGIASKSLTSRDSLRSGYAERSSGNTLVQEWLEKERERSDPEKQWTKQIRWAEEVWAGKSMAGHEIPRWLYINGCEDSGYRCDDVEESGPKDDLREKTFGQDN